MENKLDCQECKCVEDISVENMMSCGAMAHRWIVLFLASVCERTVDARNSSLNLVSMGMWA